MAQDYDRVTLISDELLAGWIDKHDRLKELLTIKRNAEAILNDDTVNSWYSNVTPKYSITEVKAAQEAFSNAVKETDEIIEKL